MSAARRNLKEADDESADPTNRNRIEGLSDVGNRAMDRDAHTHPGVAGVNPAGPEPRTSNLPWEISTPARKRDQAGATDGASRRHGVEKSAEAVVARGVGKAGEALQCRKTEPTDRPSRERRVKGRIF